MLNIIKAESLKLNNQVVHGISSRSFGSMSFDHNREEVISNRASFLKDLGISGRGSLARAQLIHGNNIHTVTAKDLKKGNRLWQEIKLKNYDGLTTSEKDIWLSLTVADCLPIMFWDDSFRAVGIAHAGWKSTLNEISRKMVKKFKKEHGIGPQKLNAYIGPSIHRCCFEVKDDVYGSFKRRFPKHKIFYGQGKRKFIDLQAINQQQLTKAGMLKKKIEVSDICTRCNHVSMYSYRAGDRAKSQLALIGIKNI